MKHRISSCKRGYVTWSISRIGVMMAVVLLILLLYMIYQYVSCVNASDAANQEAEDLAAAIEKTYSGPSGLETTYTFPQYIENHPYSLNIVSGAKRGILVDIYGTRCSPSRGGASLASPVKEYPTPVKNETEENVTIIIKNIGDGVRIARKQACVKCVVLDEFHYTAPDDCDNPN